MVGGVGCLWAEWCGVCGGMETGMRAEGCVWVWGWWWSGV